MAGGAARHRRREAVLAQGEERKAVVAALERREVGRKLVISTN